MAVDPLSSSPSYSCPCSADSPISCAPNGLPVDKNILQPRPLSRLSRLHSTAAFTTSTTVHIRLCLALAAAVDMLQQRRQFCVPCAKLDHAHFLCPPIVFLLPIFTLFPVRILPAS